ncbi:MAG: peptidyl-prolyl cis-trans isomerase [Deltaproteobacteria bacterium]|nr:peptidyl-prolyl cis-trans isomerase [Deltaproteobacteria bacterium]MBW1792820.1 peptidyl-prolyl cis-trans isomerase [Deltaproteobacteria bacterium]MBW2329519.1 peptidyl-prolyl cis-trans isomerase [Deltaproteobacteria bacterium]
MMRKLSVFALMAFFLLATADHDALYCASERTMVLAEVNGETIDETAIQDRIKAIHRYKPLIQAEGGAGSIKILDLLEEMIDEALIIQDAYRVELDRHPDFEKKLQASIKNQSVIRLRKEEVLDKIDIGEEDLLDYFKKHYEKDGSAPEGEFEKRKRRITKKLKKEKEKELSKNFVAMLRKQADIQIDKELFDLLDPEKDYAGKKSVAARVNGQPIPLDDMVHDMKRAFQKRARMFSRLKTNSEQEKMREELKQQSLDGLITYELVEQEALRRNYTKDPAFMDIITRRKEGLLINEFKEKIIYPLAIPAKKELTKYYEENIDDFRKGYEVWFREMTFQAREDAEKALKELKEGANFEYLAAQVSERWTPKGARVWVSADGFPLGIRNELNRLEVGQISDVFADGRLYKIIKLKGKRGGKPEEFSRVARRLKGIVGQQKFNIVLSDYLAKLRKESNIKINKKALKRIEEKYRTD